MSLPRAILGLTAIAFIGFGVAFTLWPEPMAGIADLRLPSATARVDFAATYGGFELGFGAFPYSACGVRPGLRPGCGPGCWP